MTGNDECATVLSGTWDKEAGSDMPQADKQVAPGVSAAVASLNGVFKLEYVGVNKGREDRAERCKELSQGSVRFSPSTPAGTEGAGTVVRSAPYPWFLLPDGAPFDYVINNSTSDEISLHILYNIGHKKNAGESVVQLKLVNGQWLSESNGNVYNFCRYRLKKAS